MIRINLNPARFPVIHSQATTGMVAFEIFKHSRIGYGVQGYANHHNTYVAKKPHLTIALQCVGSLD
jgi:hypothetical protein